jgi:hypothetical protein
LHGLRTLCSLKSLFWLQRLLQALSWQDYFDSLSALPIRHRGVMSKKTAKLGDGEIVLYLNFLL